MEQEKTASCYWGMLLALLVCIAASIVSETIRRFVEKPAFLSITDSRKTVSRFPTVGICPETRYPDHKVDKFLSEIHYPHGLNFTTSKLIIPQMAALYTPGIAYNFNYLRMVEFLLDYNGLTVKGAARRLITSWEEMLLRCRLFGHILNCTSLFTMELTNYGFCCIFNGRSLSREMMSSSFKMSNPAPLYTTSVGPWTSLISIVNNTQNVKDIPYTYKWVFLEQDKQFAETVGNGTQLFPNSEVWVGLGTERFIIADEESSIRPQFQTCSLSSTQLKYFTIYSKRYCMLECEMAHAISRCQCVRVNHPRPNGIPPCRARNLLCIRNIAVTSKMCNCRVTCDSAIEYLKVQSYPILGEDHVTDQFYSGLDLSKVSVVRAYLVKHETRYHNRRTYYTAERLFSQLGGIFTIFFGCSVLTLIEIVQLASYSYFQYKADKNLNKKSQLLFSLVEKKKKKMQSKIVDNNKVVVLQPW